MTRLTREDVLSDPVVQTLNPDGKHFLARHKLTKRHNGHADWCDVYALVPVGIQHLKVIPAFWILLRMLEEGKLEGIHTLVVPSSGNTADAIIRLAHAFGLKVKVILLTDTPPAKKGNLAVQARAEVISVPTGVQARAEQEAMLPGHLLLDQYSDDNNVHSHRLFTGPEVWRVMENSLDFLSVAMGSGGTITGVSQFLRPRGVKIIGSRPLVGERVPGDRDKVRMAEVSTFAYEAAADVIIEGTRKEAFLRTRKLWGAFDPRIGISGALASYSLDEYLARLAPADREERRYEAAFLIHDLGYLYCEYIGGELDEDEGVT